MEFRSSEECSEKKISQHLHKTRGDFLTLRTQEKTAQDKSCRPVVCDLDDSYIIAGSANGAENQKSTSKHLPLHALSSIGKKQ